MTDREAIDHIQDIICENNLSFPVFRTEHDALKVAIEALQEREERSKGCEHCYGATYLFARAWSLPTNFCPMCGRPLKGAEK